jgi:hypothetical protein
MNTRTTTAKGDAIAQALTAALISPNALDVNGEPANPTDGLYAVARAINNVAKALDRLADNQETTA